MRSGMRCATCGTENAPDSRFCGGCGARLEPSRAAPTVKVPDDAPIAPPTGGHHHVPPVRIPTPVPASFPTPPPGSLNAIGHLPTPAPGTLSHGSMPPQPRAGSIAPQNAQPAIPSTVNRAASPPPVMSSPSLSMAAAPRRSGALIAFVLVADLGLAGAGAYMLLEGLRKPKADARPAQKTEASTPAPSPVATAPAPAAAPVAAPGSAAPEPPKSEPVAARDPRKDPKRHADTKSGGGKLESPEDPYGAPAPDLSQDIERAAGASLGSFHTCLQTAIQTQPIHGDVRIAFTIEPDGHVDHAQAVVNTTGSDALATCLSATIATWTFAPHPGPAASYERPFNYP